MVGEQSFKLSTALLSNALPHLLKSTFVLYDPVPIIFELVFDFIYVMLC